MKTCHKCSAELADSATKCPACGASIGDESDATAVLPHDSQADTPTRLETPSKRSDTPMTTTGGGQFVSGTVLAGRYRIVGRIGKGGMGEVYKAEDLELEQTVALKFLPESLSRNEELLRRFRGEVRNARQVSHRNVCRVFDIGETEGLYYITMEYIDGDDLSMLLRRIGRLPSDKAVDISREICMGLAAIHKAGILHRDLKPANIIIDSRGEARITDFGIAGLESDLHGSEARVGTPAYMSPEQADGRDLTKQSDIYSLGLLLYEIFTGKQAYEGESVQELRVKHATTNPKNPSEIVPGIDKLIEKVIERCLEKDPQKRPESAMAVAMSLPGGDPLSVALEAGETPSPEMVAASPKVGSLRPAIAFSLLAVIFLGFGLATLTSKYTALERNVPLDKSGDVLQDRGREIVEKYGYRQNDFYSAFVYDPGYIEYLKKNDPSPERWQRLSTGQPAVMRFWYRTSPKPLAPLAGIRIEQEDPPETEPGMTRLRLDTKGRLTYFRGVPPRVDEPAVSTGGFDWAGVFKDAGLDLAAFVPIEPQWSPPNAFDERRAFSGKYPEAPDIDIRIEAAAYRGKLVHFDVIEPWTTPPGLPAQDSQGTSFTAEDVIVLGLYFGVLIVSGWLAVRNIREGRSDTRGTVRIVIFVFAIRMISWAFTTHFVGGLQEIDMLVTALQSSLYWSTVSGLMYLAFEPIMRKSVPERVISWNRLLAGDWRDPLIGRDVLIGAASASIVGGIAILLGLIPLLFGQASRPPGMNPRSLSGIAGFPGIILSDLSSNLLVAFIFSFLILFLGLLLRRKSLGVAAVLLLTVVVFILDGITSGQTTLELVGGMFISVVLVVIPARFGVLAMISFLLFLQSMDRPVIFGTWHTAGYLAYALVLFALAVFGFYTSTAGQKLWQGKLLGDGD